MGNELRSFSASGDVTLEFSLGLEYGGSPATTRRVRIRMPSLRPKGADMSWCDVGFTVAAEWTLFTE